MKWSLQSRSTPRIVGRFCPLTYEHKRFVRGLLEGPDAALCRARKSRLGACSHGAHLSWLSGEGD
jgi:hypothetical protein